MPDELTKAFQEIVDRVIDLCRHAESTGEDPFAVNVTDLLEKLKLMLTAWKTTAQLAKDAEAIYMIATVIKLQEAVVRHKSSLLYTDPLLVELKILASQPGDLARSFLRAWRPLVALQQVNLEQLRLAYSYWSNLRKMQLDEYDGSKVSMRLDQEELRSRGILADEVQSKLLEGMHEELIKSATDGRADYWEFVSLGDFTSTVRRAVLVSFLVTLGYAELEIEPLENRIWLRPKVPPEIPKTAEKKSLVVSLKPQEVHMP